jgi:4-hydroxyphenylacetate 3-monooxygenase
MAVIENEAQSMISAMSNPRSYEYLTEKSRLTKIPPTGSEFLESIRDGRVIYLDGKKVEDVTIHPGFRNSARSFARMYDALHDREKQETLTYVTERGTRVHKFYKLAKDSNDLLEGRDAISEWAHLNFGVLSRGPDYKAALVVTLAQDAEFYGEYAQNVINWYEKVADGNLFVNLSLLNPKADRFKPPSAQKDIYLHVVKERDDGIVVRGARMVSTGAAFSHVTYVSQYFPGSALSPEDADLALGFFLPMNAPGLKFIGRHSYEDIAHKVGTPFDYPLSSRFDESDLGMVLDDVFIPWENVIAYKNPSVVNALMKHGFGPRFMFHAAVRVTAKLEFLCGLLLKATEMDQTINFRGVQTIIGELLGYRHQMWGLATAIATDPVEVANGYVIPNPRYALQWRNCYGAIYSKFKEAFYKILAGGLLQIPSSAKDFQSEEIKRYLNSYYRGANSTAEERVKLLRLIWDLFATEMGGRSEMHEWNFSGSFEGNRLETYFTAKEMGDIDKYKAMVDECMSHYDLNGWVDPSWTNE